MALARDKRSGFTLIELLAIIGIIVILSAILFPVFAAAQERNRAIECLSQEKQIGAATLMYSEDYDDKWPLGANATTTTMPEVPVGWAGLIYPYLKSIAVFRCPDDPLPYDIVSYAINTNTCTRAADGPHAGSRSLSDFHFPSTTVLYCEAVGSEVNPSDPRYSHLSHWYVWNDRAILLNEDYSSPATDGQSNAWGYSTNPANTGMTDVLEGCQLATGYMSNDTPADTLGLANYPHIAPARHSGGSNFVLCDGHVKWFAPSSVSAGRDYPPVYNLAHSGNAGCTPAEHSAATNEALGDPFCGNASITFNPF